MRLDGPTHNDKRLRLVEIVKALLKDKKVGRGAGGQEGGERGGQEGGEEPPLIGGRRRGPLM